MFCRTTQIAHAECFKMLTKGKLRIHATAQLKVKPVSLHFINGNLWCALGNEIRAWTTGACVGMTSLSKDDISAWRHILLNRKRPAEVNDVLWHSMR